VCDLLICDEAHRLKNDQTLTNKVYETSWHLACVKNLCIGTSGLAFRAFSSEMLKMQSTDRSVSMLHYGYAGSGQSAVQEAGAAVRHTYAEPPG
jgi:hypothetical protein